MGKQKRDFTLLDICAGHCGLVPYYEYTGAKHRGLYSLPDKQAPIDLSECAEDEKSILKAALVQLSEKVNDDFWETIEEQSWL